MVTTEQDILSKLQNKILRIIYIIKRSEDAWRHNNNAILPIKELYDKIITNICFKHHTRMLPIYVVDNIMPSHNYYTETAEQSTKIHDPQKVGCTTIIYINIYFNEILKQ